MKDASRTRTSPLAWAGVALFFALVGAFGWTLLRGEGVRDPMVGQPAPPIDARLLAGSVPDGAYVVNFWATWCTPCIAEHPVLMEMAESGTPIVGVAYRDEEAKMAAWLTRAGNPYAALYFDEGGESLAAWGVRGVPETFVVGADGVILERVTGAVETPLQVD